MNLGGGGAGLGEVGLQGLGAGLDPGGGVKRGGDASGVSSNEAGRRTHRACGESELTGVWEREDWKRAGLVGLAPAWFPPVIEAPPLLPPGSTMGLCKCPKRKVTNLFCFEHRVNVCEHCLVANHAKVGPLKNGREHRGIGRGVLDWLSPSSRTAFR